MLTEEQKVKNFNLFIKKLNDVGVQTDLIESNIKNKITLASYSLTNEYDSAYEGSLLNIILRIFTPFAIKINELLPENLRVDQNKLIKVCLLHQLSKCEMFIPNDNNWEVEKRGMVYKYAPFDFALKMGMRSLILSQENGVQFTTEEIEAMTILDREPNDEQARFHANILSVIIRQAVELTMIQLKKK